MKKNCTNKIIDLIITIVKSITIVFGKTMEQELETYHKDFKILLESSTFYLLTIESYQGIINLRK